jgi:WD40 repeat protein
VASGKQIRSFVGHTEPVESVAFSPDGRFVLTGSNDWTAALWDAATGRLIRSLVGHKGGVDSVAFSSHGRFVLTGSMDGTARLWDASTGRQIHVFEGRKAPAVMVAFSPDGRRVLTGSDTAKLWDAETGKQIRSFEGHTASVTSVGFSPDGRRVVTGSEDDTARLWDAETGQQIRIFEGRYSEEIHSAVLSPDGRFVLTAGHTGGQLWDAATAMPLRSFPGPTVFSVSEAFSPDGRFVVVGTTLKAELWDVRTGQAVRSFEGYTSNVSSVAFSLDGRSVLMGIRAEELLLLENMAETALLWDTETGKRVRAFGEGHHDVVNAVAISPDGHSVLTGGGFDGAQLWDVATGRQIRSFMGTANVSSVAFSPDGSLVLTADDDLKTAQLWDEETGRQIRVFDWPAIAFSPDGRQVLVGRWDGAVRLWDVATGQQRRVYQGPKDYVASVTFSPDGRKVLASSWHGTATLWNAATGQGQSVIKGDKDPFLSAVFFPDGRRLLTRSYYGRVQLWDAATGRQIRAFEGHTGRVNSVALSPDGRFVLTGSKDTTAKLWDAATGKELATLLSFENGGWAVVDPQGRFDTSDLDGGAPLVWVASSEPMRALPLEIFMRDYYTPRLLSRIMNGEPLPPIRPISEIKNRVQPDVGIVSVARSKTHAGRADVVVHAASHTDEKGRASGLQDLRLFRNGQMVDYLEGTLKDGDFTFSNIQLPTSAKSVTFTAYAFNSERIKSATAQKDYAYEPGPPAKPRAWLLQIGVNRYRASGCELHDSANDAERLSKILADRLTARGLGVRAVKLVSTDQVDEATKENIRSALAAIAASATPDDVFFLSFSGHGYSNQRGQFYILPSDVQGTCAGVDAEMLRSAISADELTEWLRPIDAGEMTFILDSCDSASSVESNNFKPGPMGSRGLGQLAYDKRMRILAASQPNQAARESDRLRQGLLSYALTQDGLVEGKADWRPVDQKITVGEWLGYAADAVPKILEAGAVRSPRGFVRIGQPMPSINSVQTPAVFDFSKKDTFVLQ